MGPLAWAGLQVIALLPILALIPLARAALRRWRGRGLPTLDDRGVAAAAIIGAYLLGTLATVAFASLVLGAPFYDRGLLPLIPAAGMLLLALARSAGRLHRPSLARLGVPALVCAAFSLVLLDASATFDASRWRTGERLVALGYQPHEIDAGYEWFGWHQPGPPVDVDLTPARQAWWRSLYGDPEVCVEVTHSRPARSGEVLEQETVRARFGARFVLVTTRPDDGQCQTS
jgi:hypothetical protein